MIGLVIMIIMIALLIGLIAVIYVGTRPDRYDLRDEIESQMENNKHKNK